MNPSQGHRPRCDLHPESGRAVPWFQDHTVIRMQWRVTHVWGQQRAAKLAGGSAPLRRRPDRVLARLGTSLPSRMSTLSSTTRRWCSARIASSSQAPSPITETLRPASPRPMGSLQRTHCSRCVDARRGRRTSSPPQLGQIAAMACAQVGQKVHSYVQM
jgi:hypothetical protein